MISIAMKFNLIWNIVKLIFLEQLLRESDEGSAWQAYALKLMQARKVFDENYQEKEKFTSSFF